MAAAVAVQPPVLLPEPYFPNPNLADEDAKQGSSALQPIRPSSPEPPGGPHEEAGSTLSSELVFSQKERNRQSDLDRCVQLAEELKDESGNPTPFSMKWELLNNLPRKTLLECTEEERKRMLANHLLGLPLKDVREYDEEGNDLLQAKFTVSGWLAGNDKVFSPEVLSRISPAALFVGAEGSGKSSTVAGVIGRAITFTSPDVKRKNLELRNTVGTRCPTKITVRMSTDSSSKEDRISLSGIDTSVQIEKAGVGLSPNKAADVVAAHMSTLKSIGDPPSSGISETPIVINIETAQELLPLVCFDLPGMVGEDNSEPNKLGFKKASDRLTEQMIKNWVLTPGTASRAFAVTSTKYPLKFGSFLKYLLDPYKQEKPHYFHERVSWVVTGIDLILKDDSNMKAFKKLKSDSDLKNFLLSQGLSQSVVDYTNPQSGSKYPANFFLVCNADMAEDEDEKKQDVILQENEADEDVKLENRYEQVKLSIKEEVNETASSRTGDLLKSLAAQRLTYISKLTSSEQARANTEWGAWTKQHIGLRALRSYVHEISLQDATQELQFASDFLQACQAKVKKQVMDATSLAKSVEHEPNAGAVLEDILMSMKDTFHYLVANVDKKIPVTRMRKHLLPSQKDVDQFLSNRATLLKEDVQGLSQFPATLSDTESDYLCEKVMPVAAPGSGSKKKGRRPQIQGRVNRFVTNFYLRVALCAPLKVTEDDLEYEVGNGPSGQVATTLQLFLTSRVEDFIKEKLDKQAVNYASGGMERIINSAVDSAMQLLLGITKYRPYLVKNGETTTFYKELQRFAQTQYTGIVIANVKRECEAAASSISTPIIPQFPTHFRLTGVLLPQGSAFVRKFLAARNDVRDATVKRDKWESVAWLKDRITQTLSVATATEHDAKFDDWDWLGSADSRKALIDVVSELMSEQKNSDTLMGFTSKNNAVTPEDVDEFNHNLLLYTRSIIVQYSFQLRVLLPKTSQFISKDDFLIKDDVAKDFLAFVLTKTKEEQADEDMDRLIAEGERRKAATATIVTDEEKSTAEKAPPIGRNTRPSSLMEHRFDEHLDVLVDKQDAPSSSAQQHESSKEHSVPHAGFLPQQLSVARGEENADELVKEPPRISVQRQLVDRYSGEIEDLKTAYMTLLTEHTKTLAPLKQHAEFLTSLQREIAGGGAAKMLNAIVEKSKVV